MNTLSARLFPTVISLCLLGSISIAQTTTNVQLFGVNLIKNATAEEGEAAAVDDQVKFIPNWNKEGYMTAFTYRAGSTTPWPDSSWPSRTSPGPASRGLNYFACASVDRVDECTADQTIDLEPAANIVDTAEVLYELSGYFGGSGLDASYAELKVEFYNSQGIKVDGNSIGAVSPGDRGAVTGLLERKASGKILAKTRKAKITLSLKRGGDWNRAMADNLSFALFSPSVPATIQISPAVELNYTTEVGRNYQLQYVTDLGATDGWKNLGAPFIGDGSTIRCFDSVELGKTRRYYRMMVNP